MPDSYGGEPGIIYRLCVETLAAGCGGFLFLVVHDDGEDGYCDSDAESDELDDGLGLACDDVGNGTGKAGDDVEGECDCDCFTFCDFSDAAHDGSFALWVAFCFPDESIVSPVRRIRKE